MKMVMVVMGIDGGTPRVTISIIVIIIVAIVILMIIIIIAIMMIRQRCWREVKSVTKAAVTDAKPRDSNE